MARLSRVLARAKMSLCVTEIVHAVEIEAGVDGRVPAARLQQHAPLVLLGDEPATQSVALFAQLAPSGSSRTAHEHTPQVASPVSARVLTVCGAGRAAAAVVTVALVAAIAVTVARRRRSFVTAVDTTGTPAAARAFIGMRSIQRT